MCITLVRLSPDFLGIELNYHTDLLTMLINRTRYCIRLIMIGHNFVSDRHDWTRVLSDSLFLRKSMSITLVRLSPDFLGIELNYHTDLLRMHINRTRYCIRLIMILHNVVSDRHDWTQFCVRAHMIGTSFRVKIIRRNYFSTKFCVDLPLATTKVEIHSTPHDLHQRSS